MKKCLWFAAGFLAALLAMVPSAGRGPALPVLDYPITGVGPYTRLPCGEAGMLVLGGRGTDVSPVVLWTLDGRPLAQVYIREQDFIALLDYDFDGRIDFVEVAPSGSGLASDFYHKVSRCKK